MIAFLCTGCHKQLSAKEDLAGKKVKCRACGNMTVIPGQAAGPAPAPDNMPTLAPPTAGSARSGLKTQSAPRLAADPPTQDHSDAPDPGNDSSLTDFLSPPQSDDELGRLGKYRILKILGHGGMGVVFKAEDPNLKRLVAVKAMLPTLAVSESSKKRFLREAQAMAAVKHDHIVTIYQVDEERGVPFLAMEFLAGEPLDERLKREAKPPLPEVLRIGREVAKALGAAHATGLIHRDIKPANIWLEAPESRVKILDFGLARAAAQESGLTQQGAIIGTPSYMAPEQANGQAVDARSDLFSLGCVLYRMTTGELPFKGKDTLSTLMAVAMDQPAPPDQVCPEAPAALSELIMLLLSKDPDGRPESAAAVVEALKGVDAGVGRGRKGKAAAAEGEAAPEAATRSLPGRRRKKRAPKDLRSVGNRVAVAVAAGVVGASTLAVLIGVWFLSTPGPRPRPGPASPTGPTAVNAPSPNAGDAGLPPGQPQPAPGGPIGPAADDPAAKEFWKEEADHPGRPVDDAWLKATAVLTAEEQLKAVMAKLKALNPGFDGKETHRGDKPGVITFLQFLTGNVTDISPLQALPGLQSLTCTGGWGPTGFSDLSPLKVMKLTYLDCAGTKVGDLLPLKDMPLTYLDCRGTQVSDLSPLKGLPLTILACNNTKVSDLSPLKGMKLTSLNICENRPPVTDLSPLKGMPLEDLKCQYSAVSDLSPLKGMPLTNLWCYGTPVTDLSPLKGMPLTSLECWNTKIGDLSPLKDMKLTFLNCSGTQVSDLSPLKGMPLTGIECDFKPERDADILRSLKTLEKINRKPAADFWKDVDAKKP